MTADHHDHVLISSPSIRLGQFLKLANVIESGADAKLILAEGVVRVNGEVEVRRGRQLIPDDVVSLDGVDLLVASADRP